MEQLKNVLVLLTIPALLSVGLLWIAGGGDGVYHHEGILRFDQAPQTVYEWLTEPEHRVEWVDGLASSACDRRAIEPGAVLREVVRDADGRRERDVEVLAAEDGRAFGYAWREPGRTVEVRIQVGVLNSGRKTRLDYQATCSYDAWWARIAEPILGARFIRDLEADFSRLDAAMRAP